MSSLIRRGSHCPSYRHLLMSFYIPGRLLVRVAWVSIFLDVDSTAAGIVICLVSPDVAVIVPPTGTP